MSIAFRLLALVVCGEVKGHFTGVRPLWTAAQTALVGGRRSRGPCDGPRHFLTRLGRLSG
jgi:hypothetical protein